MNLFDSWLKIFIVILLIVIILITFSFLGWLNPVKSTFLVIAKPFIYIGDGIGDGIGGFFGTISSISSLHKENNQLREEKESLEVEMAKLSDMARENDLLREQLGFAKREEYQTEFALIIGKDPEKLGNSILINRGHDRNVKEGDTVISSSGALVGKVQESFANSAKILLILDENSTVSAITSESRTSGIMRGEHGLSAFMDTIPQNDNVAKGDVVVTSGLAGEFENGILIGTIGELDDSDNTLFKKGKIEPAVNFHKLESVFIITGVK